MNATELKYGDVVYCTNPVTEETEVVRVEFVYSEKLVKITQGHEELIRTLSPVPLTAEILKKNGWEKRGNDYIKESVGLVLHSVGESFLFYIITGDDNKYLLINDIDYVHQLQHIIWALEIDDDLKI